MNVFDFDKTIYDGDSTTHFCIFIARRHPRVILDFIGALPSVLAYKTGKKSKTEMKERLYRAFTHVGDMEREVELFWDSHMKNIEKWYLEIKKTDDVVISASPEFLLEIPIKKLGVGTLIASRVDAKTGKYTGLNCWGNEKPRRFAEHFGKGWEDLSDNFYSDSYSDSPMARIAKKAYIIKKHTPLDWGK